MREAPNTPPSSSRLNPNLRKGARVTERILPAELQQEQAQSSFVGRVLLPYLESLVTSGTGIARNINTDDIRVRLLRAGFPRGLTATRFAAYKILGLFIGALLFAAYFPIIGLVVGTYGYYLPPFLLPLFGVVGALYGYRMPDIWLAIQTRKRQREIQLALPDMIDLISISVEAGLGLQAAIQRISERFQNPLSEEFLRTLQEVKLGRAQVDALRDMTRRVDIEDLTTLLTAIIQAEQLGLAVSNVLRVQSERLRDKRAQRAREAAQKAPIKMTFPLVLFIFPALFTVILGPALIKIFLGQATF